MTDYRSLEPRELDLLIAERVFDWCWFHCVADTGVERNQFCSQASMEIWRGQGWKITPIAAPRSFGGVNDASACPRFSADISSAMQVVNHLRPQFEDSFCGFYQLRDDDGALIKKWEASCVFERDIFIPNARVQFNDSSKALSALARAICEAALAAIEVCEHKWIDATNEVVSGTAYCEKCGKLESLSKVSLLG